MTNEQEQRLFEIGRLLAIIEDFQVKLRTIDDTLLQSVDVVELTYHMDDICFELNDEKALIEDQDDDDDFTDPAGGSGLHSHI